jgi:hypothetical protein
VLRLLVESDHAVPLIDADDAEARRIADGHLDRRDRRIGALLDMEPQHLGVVHLVHVVAREHDDVQGGLTRDRIEVLVHGIGRAEIPVLADALLRGKDFDEFAQLFRDDIPTHADVTIERQRFVLRGDVDMPQPGIDAVAEREVDDAVRPAEIHRRLRAIFRERIQAFSHSAGEQNHENIVEFHCLFGHPSHNAAVRGVVASITIGVGRVPHVGTHQVRHATRKPRPASAPSRGRPVRGQR